MSRVSFELEYIFRASPAILYKFLTDPECLIRWYCDAVEVENDDIYSFNWEGFEEIAYLIQDVTEEKVRFRWEDSESENEYWELRFYKSEVTEETVLEITDFCDDDEVDDQKQIWDSQIARLRIATGG